MTGEKPPPGPATRRGLFCSGRNLSYGVTVMVTALLTTLPIVAVMVTLPPVVRPATSVTTPAATVARLVLLEVQVATSVTGKEPLHVRASADKVSVVLLAVKGGRSSASPGLTGYTQP